MSFIKPSLRKVDYHFEPPSKETPGRFVLTLEHSLDDKKSIEKIDAFKKNLFSKNFISNFDYSEKFPTRIVYNADTDTRSFWEEIKVSCDIDGDKKDYTRSERKIYENAKPVLEEMIKILLS